MLKKKTIMQEIKKDVVTRLYDGELQLEKIKLERLEEIHQKFRIWTAYMEKKASKQPIT